jgi:hypothetical protein
MNRRSFITSILGILAIGPAVKAAPRYTPGLFALGTDITSLFAGRPYVKTLHPNELRYFVDGSGDWQWIPAPPSDDDDFTVYYTYTTP